MKPIVVFIDHHDSFACTIAHYFAEHGAEVIMYKSSCSLDVIEDEKPSLIVLGPGPNDPKHAGNYLDVIDRFHKTIPIFGICLGFQALMEYFGTPVVPLMDVVHGASCMVFHDGKTIFYGVDQPQEFGRYNSLGVFDVPDCFEISAREKTLSSECFETSAREKTLGEENAALGIVMAARHKTFPIEGVQFHPESILSMRSGAGKRLIGNVLEILNSDRSLKN